MRRVIATSVSLLVLLAPTAVAASSTPSEARLDTEAWELLTTVQALETVTDPTTGEKIQIPVTTTVSVYSPGGVVDSDCTKTETQSTPVRNFYGGSPTNYRTWSYGYVELSSGCTGSLYWENTQQRTNWLGHFVDVVVSDWFVTGPGEADYSFLTRNCSSLDTTDWRGWWTESPTYTSVVSLECH